MTDFDASRDDDLVSAYLDGEATPDERARVEHDPRLQQRLAEFRRVAAAVGTPQLSADTPDRDALLARAVAQSPIERRSTPASSGPDASAPVVDLAARRRRNTIILSAAAAIIVVALAVPALLRDSDSNEVGTGLEVASEGLGDGPEATQEDEEAASTDDNAEGFSG